MKPKKSIEERLETCPELRTRFERMLDIAENTAGDLIKADDVEDRVTEEIRHLGRELIHNWAKTSHQRQIDRFKAQESRHHAHGKKNSTGKQTMDE